MDFGVLTIAIFVILLAVAVYFCCRVKKTPGHVIATGINGAQGGAANVTSPGALSTTPYVTQTASYPQQVYPGPYPVSPNGTNNHQMPYPPAVYSPNGLNMQDNRVPYPIVGGGGMPMPNPNPVIHHDILNRTPAPYGGLNGGIAPSAPPQDDLPPPYEAVISQRYAT